jgi:small GTP-binding protein
MDATPQDDQIDDQENELEAALAETIQTLEQFQAELSYNHAQSALQQLLDQFDLTPREQTGLEEPLQALRNMLDKLEHEVVHIAVFGMVSRGKSSLLNALMGDTIFATGPTHGVTRTSQRAQWHPNPSDPIASPPPSEFCSDQSQEDQPLVRFSMPGQGKSRIELIDTPGIDEVLGEAREALAQRVAQQADLILFVIAGDMTRVEFDALSQLRQVNKPILLVFNKIDQFPAVDRELIYRKIRDERVRSLLSPEEIVMAAAAPLTPQPYQRPDGSWGAELLTGPPQVTELKLKILEILEREGKALVALNTMLFADDVQEQVVERKLQIRDRHGDRLIWQCALAKALATALNPITLVDVVSSAVVDVAMIIALSKLYGLPMTQRGAIALLRNIAIAMGGVSITELLTNLGLSSLKGMLGLAVPATGGTALVPYFSVAMAQAAVAGVSTYTIGQITKQYLVNGASWGPNSPKVVVQEILDSVDQAELLNRIKGDLREKLKPPTGFKRT